MMQAVDGKSSHTEGYYFADKNAETTLEAFRSYHVMAERQTGKKLRCIRTDGGGEFCNELWDSYCKEFGIIHKTTSPYSSQSNGIVERANRTIIEHVRVLMHDSGLPASIWCKVASTVIYLKDFVPSARHPDTTPFEDWRGFKPDVSHLRPFGCIAYAKIPVETDGGKLFPRSVKCVLIGYFGRDAYRLLDKSTGKVYRSRDVIFEEGIGHRTLSPLPVSNEGELDHVVLQPTDNAPIPDAGLVPAHITTESTPPQPVQSVPVPNPQVTRRSARVKHPSEALLRSQASERDVEEAASLGKEWATNDATTGILSAYIESTALETTTNTTSFPDPENFWLPNSYAEAMTCPDIWAEPIEKELRVIKDRNVWEEIDPPPDVRTIGTRWTFANKYDSNGRLTGRKARLVAKGFTQIPGVDFFETYASVV
jgi:hypothetical protein